MSGSFKGYEYIGTGDGVRIERCTIRTQSLVIPDFIDGMPVTAIAPYAFEGNCDIRDITCPPQVTDIGSRAFANCPALERISFPAHLARYENSWTAGCSRLREIILPGAIVDLNLPSPAPVGVKSICIGEATRTVHIARTWKTKLDQVDVHPSNQWLSSDGTCIYNHDGTELITHATSSSGVVVAAGCETVAPRAFEHEKHLEHILLPESVCAIGERAFAESSLREFNSPSSLRIIGREAFAGCQSLVEINLTDGLHEIEERAFADCASCASVCIPASVERVGRKAFEGTGLQASGGDPTPTATGGDPTPTASGDSPTLTISSRNQTLFIDEAGVLCEREQGGIAVLEALSTQTKRYRTPDGTVRIGTRAFFEHPRLEQLELTEGVALIEPEAFMRCERLRSAKLPTSLRCLQARAFATTALTACTVPASVEHLGECALAFNYKNWHPTTNPPEVRAHVTLDPGNEHYLVEQGVLYERGESSTNAVLYVGPDINVTISQDARSIAPYAFFGVQGIRELCLPAHIRIGEATFAMRKPPERVVLQGNDGITFETMHDWRGVCALQRAFAGDGTTSARLLCATFDEEALGAQLDYEVFRYMITRLAHPLHLESPKKQAFELVLREHLGDACIELARHDDRERVDELVDIGLISAENIDHVVEAVSAANSAPIMARLHELKRTRFLATARDYDL